MEQRRKRPAIDRPGEGSTTETIAVPVAFDIKKFRVRLAEKTALTVLRDALNRSSESSVVAHLLRDFRAKWLADINDDERDTVVAHLIKLLGKLNDSNVSSVCRLLLVFVRSPRSISEANVTALADRLVDTKDREAMFNSDDYYLLVCAFIAKHLPSPTIGARLFSIAHQAVHHARPTIRSHALSLLSACREHNRFRSLATIFTFATNDDDSRVRLTAVRLCADVVERDGAASTEKYAPISMYAMAKRRLGDTDDSVRCAALTLVCHLAQRHEHVDVRNSDGLLVRMYEDAFGNVCGLMNDVEIHVRRLAAQRMGDFRRVNRQFLEQTLSKKLLPSMKLHRDDAAMSRSSTYRRRAVADEWGRGKRMYEQASTSSMDYVSLVEFGSCGAFVTGLEDECVDVRYAAISSLGTLIDRADLSPEIYTDTLHALADMFNDDVVRLRLIAMTAIRPVIKHTTVNDAQLNLVLDVLHDDEEDTRIGARYLLEHSPMASSRCLRLAAAALLNNMIAYPNDRHGVYKCLQALGANHGSLLLPLVRQLLNLHEFIDVRQSTINDPIYLAKLILVLNAARDSADIRSLLQSFNWKHYEYLRSCTQLVPAHLNTTPLALTDVTNTGTSSDSSKCCAYDMLAMFDVLARDEAHLNGETRARALQHIVKDMARSSTVHAQYLAAVCRLVWQVVLLFDAEQTAVVQANAIETALVALAMHATQYRVEEGDGRPPLLDVCHKLLDECRLRLLAMHAHHNKELAPLVVALLDRTLSRTDRLANLLVRSENSVSLAEMAVAQRSLGKRIARKAVKAFNNVNAHKFVDALNGWVSSRECTLTEPCVDTGLFEETVGRETCPDDEGQRTIYMPNSLNYVVGMVAQVRIVVHTRNYTAEQLLRLRVRVSHSGTRSVYERVCASDMHVIEKTEGMFRVATTVPISAPTAMLTPSTVRLTLMMENSLWTVPCEQYTVVPMTNVDHVSLKAQARHRM